MRGKMGQFRRYTEQQAMPGCITERDAEVLHIFGAGAQR